MSESQSPETSGSSESTAKAPQQPEPPDAKPPPHPVRLSVFDDLARSRLTVFFRLLLLIPHLIWQTAWILVIGFCVIVNWFIVLFRTRAPEDMHLLLARALRYRTHFNSYFFLVSNPYPKFFGRAGGNPVDLEIEGPDRQRRWVTFFRYILAIPAIVVAYVFVLVLCVVAFLGWFIALAVGRMPKGMRDLSAYCIQYEAQTLGYLMILTDRYPSFAGPQLASPAR